MRADLDALAAGEAGTVRIGTFQSASARLLPPTLTRFRDGWPRVGVELRNEVNCGDLDDLVRAGQLDLAFSDTTVRDGSLEVEELVDDDYVRDRPDVEPAGRARRRSSSRDLDDENLISGSLNNDSCGIRIAKALEDAPGAAAGRVPHRRQPDHPAAGRERTRLRDHADAGRRAVRARRRGGRAPASPTAPPSTGGSVSSGTRIGIVRGPHRHSWIRRARSRPGSRCRRSP